MPVTAPPHPSATHFTNRPCAAEGFDSYRYRGKFGWIMIGANSVAEALDQAQLSVVPRVDARLLEKWDEQAQSYRPVL